MTYIVNAYNPDHALILGMELLKEGGERQPSRAGDVLVMPGPVTTVFHNPMRRVLFNPVRDANPFFHLFEALWMLAGRNDATWLNQFVHDFSIRFGEEDGTMHGAYGFRWRRHFEMEGGGGTGCVPDQLDAIVRLLQKDPNDRQAVLTMWDPVADLGVEGLKDRPCNTHIYFRVRNKKLDMQVNCRSNDIIWGAYGSNLVHFSILQEYLAARIGVLVGKYYQNSFNYHGYMATLNWDIMDHEPGHYPDGQAVTTPIVTAPEVFDVELERFFANLDPRAKTDKLPWSNAFFPKIAIPMYRAHAAWRQKDYDQAYARSVETGHGFSDWITAAREWLLRREYKSGVSRAMETGK